MLSRIVAKAKNNVIGNHNELIWRLPADSKRFNELTKDHVLIMGRKTYESFGKFFTDNKRIVFSNNPDFKVKEKNVEIVHSMLQIKQYIDNKKENFVIGGAMIYNLLMPHVKKMYVTEIEQEFDGDAFFPRINDSIWKEVSREQSVKIDDSTLKYEFVTYVRK